MKESTARKIPLQDFPDEKRDMTEDVIDEGEKEGGDDIKHFDFKSISPIFQ